LKTALAELEIARADKERVALAAARRLRELEAELVRARQSAASGGSAGAKAPASPSSPSQAVQGRLFPDDKDA
jgi:hypothetical protein